MEHYTFKPIGYDAVGAKYLFQSPEYPKLVVDMPPAFGAAHLPARKQSFTIPQDYLVLVKEVIVAPGQLLIKDVGLLPDSFRGYNGINEKLINNADGTYSYNQHLEVYEVIDKPCFYLDTEHAGHYGHFTLEALSRLWCFDKMDLTNFIILTSHPDLFFVSKLLEPFGIQHKNIKKLFRPVFCRFLFIANQSYILQKSISPESHKIYDKISSYYYEKIPGYEKIYISRTNYTVQRNLSNEKEIEKEFERRGFAIIHPQKMPIERQIQAYSSAKILAGCSGSGMYNAIYAPQKEQTIILASKDFITPNDALINSNLQCSITYLTGERFEMDKTPMLAGWTINSSLVREYLSNKGL